VALSSSTISTLYGIALWVPRRAESAIGVPDAHIAVHGMFPHGQMADGTDRHYRFESAESVLSVRMAVPDRFSARAPLKPVDWRSSCSKAARRDFECVSYSQPSGCVS